MAVPGSGAITMLGIAQERKYGAYGFGTISFPITMFDLLNGGGNNGFPALNECPQPNVPSYSMSGWYGYNQTESCGECYETILYNAEGDPFEACYSDKPLPFYKPSDSPEAPWQDDSIYLRMIRVQLRHNPVGTQILQRLRFGTEERGNLYYLVDDKK